MKIPIIDFAKCGLNTQEPSCDDLNSIGDAIVNAFSTAGFVYLKNTGIPSDKICTVNRTMTEFCRLEPEIKELFRGDWTESYHGYASLCSESADIDGPAPDIKEGSSSLVGGGDPPQNVKWPDKHVPGFSTAWKEFYEMCSLLAFRILDVLAVGLKMKDKAYMKKCHSRMGGTGNITALKVWHYPGIPDGATIQPGQTRAGIHSDLGSITLLFQDPIGGLEVEDPDGNFVPAKPVPGTVLVNIGDMLQYWTKGRLKATKHRVVIPEGEKRRLSRQSVAFFVDADNEVELKPLEFEEGPLQSANAGTEEQDKIYTAKEYLDMKFTASFK